MKFLLITIAIFATVVADVSHLDGYNYNQPDHEEHSHEEHIEIAPIVDTIAEEPKEQYFPPVEASSTGESELPQEISQPVEEYLPPQTNEDTVAIDAGVDANLVIQEDVAIVPEVNQEELPQKEEQIQIQEQEQEPAKYQEIESTEQHQEQEQHQEEEPTQHLEVESEQNQEQEPVQQQEQEPIQQEEQEPVPAHTLGDNGYEYRTVKRYKYRYKY